LQLIVESGEVSCDQLVSGYGRKVLRSIERLTAGALVREQANTVSAVPLRSSFATSELIAVEAKVGRWSDVLRQAALNTWFASLSFVLTATVPSASQISEALEAGVGVCAWAGDGFVVIEGERAGLPRSYASWLFNEWSWRAWIAPGEVLK